MNSLKELLILGPGPSSSHTIGPYRITEAFLKEIEPFKVNKVEVTLYGSLALTGKGHGTDEIISHTLGNTPHQIFFDMKLENLYHPNTMVCKAYLADGSIMEKTYFSIGGGAYEEEGKNKIGKDCYPFSSFDELFRFMERQKEEDVFRIIQKYDDSDIFAYGKDMLNASFKTIERSLTLEGILPGPLKLKRVAKNIYQQALKNEDPLERQSMLLSAFAYATSEANANNELIVTSPTCGAAGVVPAVLYYEWKEHSFSMDELVKSYLVGALICDFIKENASVSGALLGCQSEIGSAASFAAASLAYLHHLSLHQIEYAAEVAMEHFLGLTCDPVDGYVQIPCIERNGVAAVHAYTAYLYAKNISLYHKNRVSFDNVIRAMKETGNELPQDLKETSLGGLAKIILC